MIDTKYVVGIEKALLSSFLFNNENFDEVIQELQPKDFYHNIHSKVFECMIELHKELMPLDEDFLAKKLTSKKIDENYLLEIMSANPISNVDSYISEIKELSNKRKLDLLSNVIKKLSLEDETKSEQIIDFIKKDIESFETGGKIEDYTGDEILKEQFKKEPLYLTGIKAIDDEIEGLKQGQLIYCTGLEETGKTHLTYKIMENISFSRKVGIISLEFGKEKLQDRLKGMIHNGHKLTPSNIKASFNCHNITNLEKTIKKWVSSGCRFIVIDSINLIENPLIRDRFERILNIGTRLFKLVQQLEITLFVISTSTKEDNKSGNPSIYGGQLLNNYCDQKWHIFRDFETEERLLWINKNKQNYRYPKIDLKFLSNGEIISVLKNHTTFENKKVNEKIVEVVEFESEPDEDTSFDISSFGLLAD